MKAIKFGEYLAEVIGRGTKIKEVVFKLRREEIKHIRRCITLYDRIYYREYSKKQPLSDLGRRIHDKFSRFGRLRREISTHSKKSKIKEMERICSYEGCEEKDNLTLDHIKRKNMMKDPHVRENLQLLCPKHHLLKEMESHLFHKGLEIDKIKKRIEDIKKGTTDCLGYKVLSENKFEKLDEESNEN